MAAVQKRSLRIVRRNERRHQRLRSFSRRIMERRQKWFYISEENERNRTTPVCLDPEYLTYPVDEDAS